jgi:hypothetical protein
MANYKNPKILAVNNSNAFDETYSPGNTTLFSGIYRCEACGHEVVSEKGKTLPPETHPQHPANVPIAWRLVVAAAQNQNKTT